MKTKLSWAGFLAFFPEIELPITLNDEALEVFSRENKVLPLQAIEEYIEIWEGKTGDGMTEYIPCFSLPSQEEYVGLVYWKGSIDKYEFVLVTFDNKGKLITRKSLASTVFTSAVLKRSVAMIDAELIIHIMAGVSQDSQNYDPNSSRAFHMEILPSGEVLFAFDDSLHSNN